jgi:hypothetical protein
VFLRRAWSCVVPPVDTSWIGAVVASSRRRPDDPGAQAGDALERLLELGATREDIHDVVRTMQWELLFELCNLVNGPDPAEEEVPDLAWGLFELGPDDEPRDRIGGLHESVLETGPSGNEMRALRRSRPP